MIFHRLGLINKNQRGVTLIELIIAIAITGIITGGITMTFFQVFDGNTRSSNHMIAVRQVQNAGYWMSRDATMAQNVQPGASAGFPLTLSWTEWDTTAHQVTYDIVNNELKRTEGASERLVAEYIDPDETSCVWDDVAGKLTITVTATVQEQSETRVYEVIPRPSL